MSRGRPRTLMNVGTAGTAAATSGTLTVDEYGDDVVRMTVITFTNIPQAVVNGTEYQSSLLYTMPEGRIRFLDAMISQFQQTTTSVLASTLNASVTGALALGTAAASSTTLNSTMANLVASTAFTSSATINVAGTAVNSGMTTAVAAVDGTTTAVPIYLNTAYATTTDVDADATQTLSGVVTLLWALIVDY